MSVVAGSLFTFDNSFVRELEGLYEPWRAATASEPRVLALNEPLAVELGVAPGALTAELLAGNAAPDGASPVAMAYAGHQFGGYSPRLGDGRALLLGEVIDVHGRRRDLHLKGSGRTPFARGGETLLPGAVLARVAASHIRVGTFEYTAARRDPALLRRLADYTLARHHPHAAEAENPYLAFFESVVDVQAALIARWMLVGFIHGVMNTDNMAISGETIDYGPCAFMDAYDPATVFSSIDHAGRYAYGNQPAIAQWNLARFAEALLPLLDPEPETAVAAATEVLKSYPDRFNASWRSGMNAKLGVTGEDTALIDDLLTLLHAQTVDYTTFFRALSASLRGDVEQVRSHFYEPAAYDAWAERWRAELAGEPTATAEAMDRVNPVYIPRNHHVEEALTAATAGDLEPFGRLVEVLARPFDERPGLEAFAAPAPSGFGGTYRTFCGT
jgi:uncharacterized protein YdiU (UPF0061 family)